jgi:hypothetical protein
MGNRQNEWVKHAGSQKNLLKNEFDNKCYVRGCTHKPKELAHIRQTPLSRTGGRDRKMVHADVMKHKSSYVAVCTDHKNDPRTKVYQHDRRMAKLGHR